MKLHLSRALPILCVVSFLENCDFYAGLRNQFVDFIRESKLSALKPQLVDGSYVQIYQAFSNMLATNNCGQDIKSLVEAIGSAHNAKL